MIFKPFVTLLSFVMVSVATALVLLLSGIPASAAEIRQEDRCRYVTPLHDTMGGYELATK